MEKRLTLSMACWGRPQRTLRSINCIAQQTINGWEALVVGDACPVMQDFIDKNYFKSMIEHCKAKGNNLLISNNKEHCGGDGYQIINQNIQNAKGKYFIFFANDDIILPNHFENYLSQIEGTDYDWVYFESYVKPRNSIRRTTLNRGCVGHSELIIRTEFLRTMPSHASHYAHDWPIIENMIRYGKYKKAINCPTTYHVMSLGPQSDPRTRPFWEQGID